MNEVLSFYWVSRNNYLRFCVTYQSIKYMSDYKFYASPIRVEGRLFSNVIMENLLFNILDYSHAHAQFYYSAIWQLTLIWLLPQACLFLYLNAFSAFWRSLSLFWRYIFLCEQISFRRDLRRLERLYYCYEWGLCVNGNIVTWYPTGDWRNFFNITGNRIM